MELAPLETMFPDTIAAAEHATKNFRRLMSFTSLLKLIHPDSSELRPAPSCTDPTPLNKTN
jgi:hypothetical protein